MKKEGKIKAKIKELKKTAKGRAILKLIYWMVFFFLLFILLIISMMFKPEKLPPKPNEMEVVPIIKEPVTEKLPEPVSVLSQDTKDKIEKTLTMGIYDYNYTFTIGGAKYIYNGTKSAVEDTGYKTTPIETLKYIVDASGTYIENTTGRTSIDNLYEELDSGFNLASILTEIKGIEFTRNLECNCVNYIYDGVLETNHYQIELEEKTLEIVSITISKENIEYKLEFKNIKGGE